VMVFQVIREPFPSEDNARGYYNVIIYSLFKGIFDEHGEEYFQVVCSPSLTNGRCELPEGFCVD
jgi:hypothetical protein